MSYRTTSKGVSTWKAETKKAQAVRHRHQSSAALQLITSVDLNAESDAFDPFDLVCCRTSTLLLLSQCTLIGDLIPSFFSILQISVNRVTLPLEYRPSLHDLRPIDQSTTVRVNYCTRRELRLLEEAKSRSKHWMLKRHFEAATVI